MLGTSAVKGSSVVKPEAEDAGAACSDVPPSILCLFATFDASGWSNGGDFATRAVIAAVEVECALEGSTKWWLANSAALARSAGGKGLVGGLTSPCCCC